MQHKIREILKCVQYIDTIIEHVDEAMMYRIMLYKNSLTKKSIEQQWQWKYKPSFCQKITFWQ